MKVVENRHLFILGMNDSGTSFLLNNLSQCKNVVSFRSKFYKQNAEGCSVANEFSRRIQIYPDDNTHNVMKVWTEKEDLWRHERNFNWKFIRMNWRKIWKENEHWNMADPRILIEKTPMSLLCVKHYRKHFPCGRFLIIHRDPYAVCEGIRRTCEKRGKPRTMKRCAKHWLRCSQVQKENIEELLADCVAVWFRYEDMADNTDEVESRIKELCPELDDLDLRRPARCHAMEGAGVRPLQNYNERHIANLSKEDIVEINQVLSPHTELLKFFGYSIRSPE